MRADIARPLGFVSFKVTTAIAGSAVIVSTNLADDYPTDNHFIDWFVLVTDLVNVGVVRRVTDYSASSGTLTVAGANFSTDSANLATVELHRFHPDRITDHYNRIRQDVFPSLGIVRDLQTLVTGQRQSSYTLPATFRGGPVQVWMGNRPDAATLAENLFTDPGLEDWTNATTLASWTLAGAGSTVNQEAETTNPKNYGVLAGGNSARLDVAVSTATTLDQGITPTVAFQGVEVNVGVWVYCLTASRVAARISASNVVNSPVIGSTHTGTGWEFLQVTATTNTGSADINAGVDVTSGAVIDIYIDEAFFTLGPSEGLDGVWEPLLNWRWTPPVAGAANGGILEFPYILQEKRRLRLIGRDLLSTISGATTTTEIDGEQLAPIYNKVRAAMATDLAYSFAEQDERNFWLGQAAAFERAYDEKMATTEPLHMPKPHPRIPDWGR
jgi:hypothetical protein